MCSGLSSADVFHFLPKGLTERLTFLNALVSVSEAPALLTSLKLPGAAQADEVLVPLKSSHSFHLSYALRPMDALKEVCNPVDFEE